MRVRVERVIDARRKVLQCSTPVGSLPLVWEQQPLPSGGDYDVELDVPAILEWGREIWRVSDGRPTDGSERPLIVGTVVGFDELGVAEIELREGLLLIETLGEPPLGTVGEAVEFRPPEIHAHPYDL